MKRMIAISVCYLTTFACAMQEKTESSFMSTYQKKRTLAQALDSGLPQKKKKFPSKAQKAFEAAIDRKDMSAAHRILKDNYYCPKYISLTESVRHDDLPDFIYWLAPHNAPSQQAHYISALHAASALGNYFFMKLLIQTGMPLDNENQAGWTALDYAVYHNRPEGVCLLLEHGASENKPNMHGRTPLYYLIELFSRGRRFPYTATMNLITTFLTHAPWNERPPLMMMPEEQSMQLLKESNDEVLYANFNREACRARYKTGLLSLKRACSSLPLDLKYKIFSYMPEDVHTEKIFRALFPFLEKNDHGLAQLVEISPMAWFISLSRAKRLACTKGSGEHERFLQRVVPLIAAYRLRRSYELLDRLEIEHRNCVLKCIQLLENEQQHLLFDVITQELLK